MSKKPSKYINDVVLYSDFIYIHYEIDEDISNLLDKINQSNKKAGIVLHAIHDYSNINEICKLTKNILILTIEKPGYSGQNSENSYNLISK